MIKSLNIVLVALLLSVSSLFAGSGHSHSVSQTTIKSNAKRELVRLVDNGKLDTSWKEAKRVSMKKQGVFSKEWVIGFNNKQIEDTSKQTLYIYLSTYGKMKGANYKGD